MAREGIPISEDQCIGDSLQYINGAFETLDSDVMKLSAATMGSVKAWVNFAGNGPVGDQVINGGLNVSSVSKTGTGAYKITFEKQLDSCYYAVIGTPSTANGYCSNIMVSRAEQVTVSGFGIVNWRTDSANALADSAEIHLVVIG